MAEFTFSEEEFFEIEKRLDIINGLKARKYTREITQEFSIIRQAGGKAGKAFEFWKKEKKN